MGEPVGCGGSLEGKVLTVRRRGEEKKRKSGRRWVVVVVVVVGWRRRLSALEASSNFRTLIRRRGDATYQFSEMKSKSMAARTAADIVMANKQIVHPEWLQVGAVNRLAAAFESGAPVSQPGSSSVSTAALQRQLSSAETAGLPTLPFVVRLSTLTGG